MPVEGLASGPAGLERFLHARRLLTLHKSWLQWVAVSKPSQQCTAALGQMRPMPGQVHACMHTLACAQLLLASAVVLCGMSSSSDCCCSCVCLASPVCASYNPSSLKRQAQTDRPCPLTITNRFWCVVHGGQSRHCCSCSFLESLWVLVLWCVCWHHCVQP